MLEACDWREPKQRLKRVASSDIVHLLFEKQVNMEKPIPLVLLPIWTTVSA